MWEGGGLKLAEWCWYGGKKGGELGGWRDELLWCPVLRLLSEEPGKMEKGDGIFSWKVVPAPRAGITFG